MTQVSHKNAKALRGKHRPHLQWLAEDLRPTRYMASYCSENDREFYHLAIQVGMVQAASQRKLYLWSSFHPDTLDYDPMVEHMLVNFKLYVRQHFHDLSEPMICQLFLFTNDPSYGALMEVNDHGDSSAPWCDDGPTAGDLAGSCVESNLSVVDFP